MVGEEMKPATLLDHIEAGSADFAWFDVPSSSGTDFAVFRMLVDAPRANDVRLTVTAREAQRCAEALGAILPTPRLLDLRWAACPCRIPPQPKHYRGGVGMDSPQAVFDHSLRVDVAIGGGSHGAVSNVGKHWVLSPKATNTRAVLYGWHLAESSSWRGILLHPSVSLPGISVIQPESAAHTYEHSDYSMTLMVVKDECRLNGAWVETADLLTDPMYRGLAVEGPSLGAA